jgi:hypothetical protein
VRAPALVQPPRSIDIGTVVKALEELQLHALEAHAPRSDQLLNFDYERLACQLAVFLGPQPSQEDLHNLSFLFANVMTQLAGGEPLSQHISPEMPRQRSRLVCAMLRGWSATSQRSACVRLS